MSMRYGHHLLHVILRRVVDVVGRNLHVCALGRVVLLRRLLLLLRRLLLLIHRVLRRWRRPRRRGAYRLVASRVRLAARLARGGGSGRRLARRRLPRKGRLALDRGASMGSSSLLLRHRSWNRPSGGFLWREAVYTMQAPSESLCARTCASRRSVLSPFTLRLRLLRCGGLSLTPMHVLAPLKQHRQQLARTLLVRRDLLGELDLHWVAGPRRGAAHLEGGLFGIGDAQKFDRVRARRCGDLLRRYRDFLVEGAEGAEAREHVAHFLVANLRRRITQYQHVFARRH
mmetsp:Transcript_71083/g.199724  ORF Transcript_71083/g.199724 Transcript_71083/m.199724 type:complete len:286 (+) Transcript_71083:1538-2395(+)